MTTKESIEAFAQARGITMTAVFVPWSQSRSFDREIKHASRKNLNWRVTIHYLRRDVLTTDYSAGIAHAPYYAVMWPRPRHSSPHTLRHDGGMLEFEVEHGKAARGVWSPVSSRPSRVGPPILPSIADVLHSLVSDSDVLNYNSFESWASELGYDLDSRKAEGIYRACLSFSLALRNGLGEQLLADLREAVQDY